jgi:hypothetical protein
LLEKEEEQALLRSKKLFSLAEDCQIIQKWQYIDLAEKEVIEALWGCFGCNTKMFWQYIIWRT